MREERESVVHKFAKEALRNWLAEGWDKDEYIIPLSLQDKQTRRKTVLQIRPDFIYCEYPFTDATHAYLRDESEESCLDCRKYRSREVYCPCLKCEKLPGNVICVADIALEHKGFVHTVFEVTHLNPPNDKKIEYLMRHDVRVIEVSAGTISKLLTTRPPYLLVERIYPEQPQHRERLGNDYGRQKKRYQTPKPRRIWREQRGRGAAVARKVFADGTRPWRCPICDYSAPHGSNFATAYGLALHIAMKWDDAHVTWRKERGMLPAKYKTLGEARQIASQILTLLKQGTG